TNKLVPAGRLTALLTAALLAWNAAAALGAPPAGWPTSISGPNGFAELGKAITKEPGFRAAGSDVEKARFVFSRLPDIATTYNLRAGNGGPQDQLTILKNRAGNDPENADSLKVAGVGNCGEWSYAFSETLGGAGVTSRAA